MPNGILQSSGLVSFAEQLGEAIGRGVARGINSGLAGVGGGAPAAAPSIAPSIAPRRRGRPPKAASGGSDTCKEPGCYNPARSKGLCSKHYQAARRKVLKR